MQWRIWDYDGETIRLISDKPTTNTLCLKGATGYNNGVYAINEICRQCYGQYNENGEMKTGISVLNLKRSDIQKVTTYDYAKYTHTGGGNITYDPSGQYKYGSTVTFTNTPRQHQYPKIWELDNQWDYNSDGTDTDKEGLIWEKENGYIDNTETCNVTNSINVKNSVWNHDYEENSIPTDWINAKYYDLLFKNNEVMFDKIYWLSSRQVTVHPTEDYRMFDFAFSFISTNAEKRLGSVNGNSLLWSNRFA